MEHNETMAVVQRVKTQLSEFYNGNSWVTDNFLSRLLFIEPDHALQKIENHNHSIEQLVGHMTAWRNFVVQKLTGNKDYDINDDSPVNWPSPGDWKAVLKEFELCQQQLLTAIDHFPIADWNSTVPGRSYTFLYLICGIIQHDYYHYGQIGGLLAALKK